MAGNDDSFFSFPISTISSSFSLLSIALFSSSLLTGHIFQGKPRKHLGKRSSGSGLLSYLFDTLFINGFRVIGYDAILGSFSPILRSQFHLSLLCMIISYVIGNVEMIFPKIGTIKSNSSDDEGDLKMITVIIGVCTVIYLLVFYIIHHVLDGISNPGGPRNHKIQGKPKWEDRIINPPSCLLNHNHENAKWKCFVAVQSHKITESEFDRISGTNKNGKKRKGCLIGEPCGRQIWSNADDSEEATTKAQVDEELVQRLARGGRPEGFNPSANPNSCDMIFRSQQIRKYIASGNIPPEVKQSEDEKKIKMGDALRKAGHFYSMLQSDDGHWAGDYGGPHFLMPGLVIAWYIMEKPKQILDTEHIELLSHYIKVHQQVDGGWGTHLESPSTMFGTVLMYVAARLLGFSKNDDVCMNGRAFIQKNGGAIMTSSWAKFYLCLLGCMNWDAHNSVPPEMWLLPNWFPFHPGRMWCHARMVYLPMGYLYGRRYVYENAEIDPIILSLRNDELYSESYQDIEWVKTRHMVAEMDNYSPISLAMRTINNILIKYETYSIFQPLKKYIRKFGLEFCLKYIEAEDMQTNYINIGPVNKVMNMLSVYDAVNNNIHDEKVENHMMRIADYLWVAEDGMKMQGYNGSQCWDTSFAIQAYHEAKLMDNFPELTIKVYKYLERTQILSTTVSQASPAYEFESISKRNEFYRHVSIGGWPFSTSAHGWPISDCTGEGLKGIFSLLESKTIKCGLENGSLNPICDQRLYDAVNILLTYQNEDGGWATYENNRGYRWYEQLNPSEVFGDIMIDYSYVECSMASLTALTDFQVRYPEHRKIETTSAINNGKIFLKSIQREDGCWYGSWACCFTYGCWFGVEGMIKCGEDQKSPCIVKACQFLLKHQRSNGGWGEDFTSCYDKDYAENGMDAYGENGSGVVNTSWALLALSIANCQDTAAIKKGIQFLLSMQLPSGDWPQQGVSGVFNRACGITYTAYRNVFPIWAIGRCRSTYGDKILDE